MADFNSSLPVRTENPGDVIIKICDATTEAQQTEVTTYGELKVTVTDGVGTSVDPTQIRALTNADVVTADQGTAAASSGAWPIKITDGTTVAGVDGTSTGLKVSVVDALPTGSNTIGAVTQASGPWTINMTQVSGATISLGQTTMSASLPVTMASNQPPIAVVLSPLVAGSTEVLSWFTEVDLLGAAVITKTYTVTALKVLSLQKMVASASGKIKVEFKIAGSTKITMFNSTANPNVEYTFAAPQQVATGVAVAVTITNLDKDKMDVFCAIEGYEVVA